MSNRPICIEVISTTPEIHELETRPRFNCYGCIEPTLGGDQRVCLPTIFPDWEVPLQGQEGESVRADSSGSCLANTTMVCSPAIDAIPKTNHSSEVSIPVEESPQRTSPIDTPAESSRVASVRNSLQGQGISGAASSLILSSWRKATEAAYSCNWRRWERWCAPSGCNPVFAPLSSILDFLASEYAEGKQYRTLNCYRQAISMTHSPIDGVVVGKHPLVVRLMRGVYNARPPQPRYLTTWDVGQVLHHISSLGRNRDLSLKQLSHKLVVLLALANASRASEIYALDIRYMSRDRDGISFAIADLTKTARPGKKRSIYYPSLKEEERLCPVNALNEYLRHTEQRREEDQTKTRLFLFVVKPYKPVVKSTIARWMKTTIHEAGIGELFSAHSVRGAAATAAHMKGMVVSDILSIADWSSDNVFKAFLL